MQCEMCGRTVGRTRRFLVESSILNVGPECERFGKPMDPRGPGAAAAARGNVPLALEKRRQRATGKDVFSDASMQVELVADYAQRIQAAREKKGWSRQDLGGRVGEREAALHRIETGALRPTDEVARRLERELGIVLFEKVDTVAAPKSAARNLTLGDVLRDALAKGKKKT